MTAIAKAGVSETGTTVAFRAAAAGDTVHPGPNTLLIVKNGSVSPVTVTLTVPGTEHGQATPDIPVVVAASTDSYIRVLREIADSTGNVAVAYSALTTVTVACLEV